MSGDDVAAREAVDPVLLREVAAWMPRYLHRGHVACATALAGWAPRQLASRSDRARFVDGWVESLYGGNPLSLLDWRYRAGRRAARAYARATAAAQGGGE